MGRRLLLGVLCGVLLYAAILFWVDAGELARALRSMELWTIPVALALTFLNYLLRFAKWERYRALLGIQLDRRTSFTIYLAGFSMGVTPGKMGEVVKSVMLKQATGTPIHVSAPIVIAERVTDLIGCLLLVGIGGLASHPELAWLFGLALIAVAFLVMLAGSHASPRIADRVLRRTPYLWRLRERVERSFESARVLLSPREILFPTLISVASWCCECLGFWLLANAFLEERVSLLFAVFAYASSAVIGALALFAPGGLGVTEWSLGALLRREVQTVAGLSIDAARTVAAGAVIITRLCTLWFAVAIGLVAYAAFQRRFGKLEIASREG